MTAKKFLSLAAFLLLGALTLPALAQQDNGPGGGGPGGGGPGGGGPGGGGPGGGFGGGPGGGGPGGGFGGGPGGGFGGPGGGGFNPAQFQQMRLQQIQQQMGATDDEFAVLSPKIQNILTLQPDATGGGRGGRGGFGGPGGPGGGFGGPGGNGGGAPNNGQPLSPVQQARQDLQTALQDDTSSPDLIKAKLDAYRSAVAKAKEDLATAQNDLKPLLTQRQEAVLVMSNILQ